MNDTQSIRLTELSHGGGCACKLGMTELTEILSDVVSIPDPNALVDATTRDDAAVYRISDDRALVVTTDFFTPIVDDPFDFGRISATNALSDIYAMGARPLFALNLVAFPRKYLSDGILKEILRGGAEVARNAGIPVMGGHSVDDPEPKFGLVAIGEAHPDRIVTNAGAKPGDVLVLSKPLGTGIVANAFKKRAVTDDLLAHTVDLMTTLNEGAAEAMIQVGANAATDVTGYGLLGHLRNIVRGSGVTAEISASKVPVIDGVRALVENGFVPGGTRRNLADVEPDLEVSADVSETDRLILSDAQTSGGLLISLPEDRAEELVELLSDRAPAAAIVGRVSDGPPGTIHVT